jgi:hypothetical protein
MTTTGKLFFTALALVLIGGGVYYFNKEAEPVPVTSATPEMFTINGEQITLVNGKYEKELAPGSASKMTVTYFGNEAQGDFNGDGKEDRAYLVTQNSGGSGTFFYLVTSLGGEAAFIGDRISPQNTEYRDGEIRVNYAGRRPGQPMTAELTDGTTKYFKFENGNLVEIIKGNPTATSTTSGKVSADSPEGKCVNVGGTWSAEYKECTGTSADTCKAIGGTYNECASACRHDPKAQACVMMCVAVCTL